ncbi:hypothetical protein IW492_15640 [Enterococcus sp. BWB1-3]|uniref:hypothetical protein n=1 Tax=Enterococcus sp. BWB1-3 TaxID=2787713 RepID=UPI0019212182|nr:hypothetical protein [Enterococcus sp. BWB1-3]MBL1230662.1 hypothetical protein [Enterococcus sp. BWB1-3]
MTLSKQAFLSQRKKVNPEVFRFLNQQSLSHFYTQDTPKTWHDYLVFAIDGSRMEVPSMGGEGNPYDNALMESFTKQ